MPFVKQAQLPSAADEIQVRTEAQITDRGASARSDQRKHARFSVEMDVTLGSDHNFYSGLAENLSAGGVFVATHLVKSIGETIELCVRIPESDQVIKGVGEVRWIREYNEASDVSPGMGIRFVEIEPGSEVAIQQFLSKRDPLLFDDE